MLTSVADVMLFLGILKARKMLKSFNENHLIFANAVNSLVNQLSAHPETRHLYSPITLAIADSVLHMRGVSGCRDREATTDIKKMEQFSHQSDATS
jgi:hypothetical protein